MDKEIDLRIQRTKKLLQEAFIVLSQEKPFYKITVHALTTKAQINRVTFYLHYKDIEDFIEQFIQEWIGRIEESLLLQYNSLFNQKQEFDMIHNLLVHIAHNANVYKMLLVTKSIPLFTPRLIDRVRQLMQQYSKEEREPNIKFKLMDIPDDVAAWYSLSAMFGTIAMWLGEDMRYSPRFLAKQLVKLNPFRPNKLRK